MIKENLAILVLKQEAERMIRIRDNEIKQQELDRIVMEKRQERIDDHNKIIDDLKDAVEVLRLKDLKGGNV